MAKTAIQNHRIKVCMIWLHKVFWPSDFMNNLGYKARNTCFGRKITWLLHQILRFFDTQIKILLKIYFLGSYCITNFCNFWSLSRTKRLKKTKNLVVKLWFRINYIFQFWFRKSKVLKSFHSNVQYGIVWPTVGLMHARGGPKNTMRWQTSAIVISGDF